MPGACIKKLWKSNKKDQIKDDGLAWSLNGVANLYNDRVKMSNKFKKFISKRGFLIANLALILVVFGVIWIGQGTSLKPVHLSLISNTSNNQSTVPLDVVSSAEIASNIARITSLPEAVAVTNQADSLQIYLANSIKIDQTIVTKPQIVTGGTKSRKDIQTHITVEGETVSSLATKFGVTSDSIKWSNGLYGNFLSTGTELKIPPVNGIVYRVKSSDTLDSLASRFQVSKEIIVAFNDIEISGLPVDEYIVIPDGVQAYQVVTSWVNRGYTPQWAGNGYYYGYCTYYAATRVAVPSNWGNANTWDDYARLSGWIVSRTPVAGAVAQTDSMSYWGHVAVVEDVRTNPDTGQLEMVYSDMNALCGWGCVGTSDWVPISVYQNYIYR